MAGAVRLFCVYLCAFMVLPGHQFAAAGSLRILSADMIEGTKTVRNLMVNGEFERNLTGASATGSGSLTRETSATSEEALSGFSNAVINSSASGEIFAFKTKAIPTYFEGQSCESVFRYSGDASDYKAYAYDTSTSSQLSAEYDLEDASSAAGTIRMFHTCGTAHEVMEIRIEATADGAGVVVDAFEYGLPTNIGTVAQATFYGGIEQVGAASCSWFENSSSGLTDYVTVSTNDTDCTNAWTATGRITAVGTTNHQAQANNMPPGEYKIVLAGAFNMSTANSCVFRLYDGTTGYQPQVLQGPGSTAVPILTFHVPYTTGGNRTFSLQAGDNHAGSCEWSNSTSGLSSAGVNASWKFYRFPTSAETIVNAGCVGTAACSNEFSATISSGGVVSNESPSGWISGNCSGSAPYTCTFDTSLFGAQPNCGANAESTNNHVSITATSSSAITYAPVNHSSGSASSDKVYLRCTRGAGDYKPAGTAPQLVNYPRMASAKITNSGTPTVATQYFSGTGGNWITSITGNSAGDMTLNITGFQVAPICTCSGYNGTYYVCGMDGAATTTTVDLYTNLPGTGRGDGDINVICQEPR